MYLKIEIDGEEQFYSFENKKIVTIGRAPECDIQLLTDGISRDHLLIQEIDGDYKFIDLGSTNGTYVNGQQIEANVETDFNSFFPVKLGAHVYVYLIDEVSAKSVQEEIENKNKAKAAKASADEKKKKLEEHIKSERIYIPKSKPTVSDHETTRVIKRPTIAVSSSKEKEERKSPKLIMIFLLAALIGFAYFKLNEKEEPVVAKKAAVKEPVAKPKPVKPKKENHKERMLGIVALDKCLGEYEGQLCSKLKELRELGPKEGFLKLGPNLFLVVDMRRIASGYKEHSLSPEMKKDLLKAMATYLGRKYSQSEIIKRDYIYETPNLDSKLSMRAAAYTDLALSDLTKEIAGNKDLQEFQIIVFDGRSNDLVSSSRPANESLKSLEKKGAEKAFLYYWRSGLAKPLINFFKSEEGKTLLN